uniref:Uncharacterized protein n=1 Tax=Aegilops tauschii TaxID=37682 RepID=M8AUJ4_AEGTA
MEFYIANPPSKVRDFSKVDTTIVEAGEDKLGVFVYGEGATDLEFRTIRRNNGESSGQWHLEKTISLGFQYHFVGSTERHLFLYHGGSSSLDAGCFSLDVKTFQLERVCTLKTSIYRLHAYNNFPPSLLSSPIVASVTQKVDEKEMLEQGTKMLQTQELSDSHHDESIVDGVDAEVRPVRQALEMEPIEVVWQLDWPHVGL